MIPILYEQNETSFTSNGLGRLSDCIRCIVTEERNGIYECEFDYPVTGVNFDSILIGRIIACTHDEQGDVQPFDIYAKTEPINGIVTFYAHHISYRLNEIVVKPYTATSCADALSKIVTNSIGSNPFTFWTNKSVSTAFASSTPRQIRNMLGGEENSILDVYGTGEYEFDKFSVKFYLHRGQDTNVSIRYGKNLIDFTNDYDASGTYTAVVPYWLGVVDSGGESETVLVTLPEWYVNSGGMVPSGREVIVPMDLSNAFTEQPTVAQLRSYAISRLSSSDAWIPNQTVKVNFVQLWQTEEYADYAVLQRLRLCDTCGVFVPMYGISLRAKVIKVIYNVLLDRYDEMELGDKPATYTSVIEKMYDSKVAGIAEGLKSINLDIQSITGAIEQQINDLEDELVTQIDSKIETWAQTSNPAASWTSSERATHVDDLWLYTGLSETSAYGQTIRQQGTYIYEYTPEGALMNESSVDLADENGDTIECNEANYWQPYASINNNIFDFADGKSTIYYGSPSSGSYGADDGDYLVDPSTGSTYRWNGSSWVKQTDYQTAITNAKNTIQAQYEQAIEDATEQIRGGTGGYIVTTLNANGQPIELLITDNLNINQAVNVWRWNSGGLGHSHNGYNGPFSDVAITQDGKINASRILTGSMTANLITAGILKDVNNKTSFNLETGLLSITKGSINLGSGNFTVNDSGVLAIKKGSINLGSGNFIATDAGKLTAIGGGLIRDLTSKNSWNLDTGKFVTQDGTIGPFTATSAQLFYKTSTTQLQLTDYLSFRSRRQFGSTYVMGGLYMSGGDIQFYIAPDSDFSTRNSKVRIALAQNTTTGVYGLAIIDSSTSDNIAHIHMFTANYPNKIYESVTLGDSSNTADLYVSGDLRVAGTKNRIVKTDNYTDRELYCYETPTPLFGDIGEAVLDDDGICYVDLDDIFSETIAERVEYQVFLQKEGEGDCWVADKQQRYFVIQGTPNLKVAWELKAKQKDYHNIRLEQSNRGLDEYQRVSKADNLLEDYITEQEALLYG